jgi:glycosyltransferase involved in cell wall biosynthesis
MGDGEHAADLKALVADLDLGDRVFFTGFVPFEDLLSNLQAATVGVIAMQRSPYSELIDTNKMYEYIALRKPVIVSRLPAIEARFDDTCLMYFTAGDSADLASAVIALYRDPQLRESLVNKSFQRYAAMRWRDVKHTYVKVIESAIGKTGGPGA